MVRDDWDCTEDADGKLTISKWLSSDTHAIIQKNETGGWFWRVFMQGYPHGEDVAKSIGAAQRACLTDGGF